jgi:peptide/nickel transport system substrate-binding protein
MRGPARRVLISATSLVLVVSACTFGNTPEPSPLPTGTKTIRIGFISGEEDSLSGRCSFRVCGQTFDPQSTSFVSAFEMDRCCFMRTLMSYDLATPDSSTTLAPDLASGAPTVSSDGLLWTFHLRKGLHYAPPMADTEIVAADLVRSIERARTPASSAIPWDKKGDTIAGYYVDAYAAGVIVGADDFTAGKASHISGLQTPDPYTLQVHLTRPAGDLGYQLAVPALGPIPANPARPDDPLGVAQGHDFDYGDVIVSSGPYMFEGSEHLDLSPPPMDQIPASGNGSAVMTLLRNPSWSAASDPLRRAWADRLEFYRVPDGRTAERLVRTGALDVVLDWATDLRSVERWRGDPTLRDRMFTQPVDGTLYLGMNLAIPPFDDLHVRRAMNMAVDRDRLVRILRREGTLAEPMLHIGIDSIEDNLLIGYDPFGVGTSGDVASARREMEKSRYDADADGRCDAAVCRSIPLLVNSFNTANVSAARAMAAQLEQIGLGVAVHPREEIPFGDLGARMVLRMGSWIKDFPDAATFFPSLFKGDSPSSDMAIGASPSTLRRLGYDVTSVPSVDAQLDQCTTALFQAQVRCWAQLDTYMSEHIVPWVPIAVSQNGWAVSDRVRFAIDSSVPTPLPAPDSLEVDSAASAPAPVPPSSTSVPDIPAGLYRTRVTPEDINRYGARVSEDDLRENTGTFTILIRNGHYTLHATATHRIFNPIQVGTYQGDGDRVRFDIQAPFPDGVLADVRWKMDGTNLGFTVDRCTGFAAKHANVCALISSLYEARPWQLVTAL